MEEKNNKNNSKINRRDFFKLTGAAVFSVSSYNPCIGSRTVWLLRQEQPFGQRIGRFGRDSYR